MKFSIKELFSKCDQIRSADLVTFTEENINGKLYFLYSVMMGINTQFFFCRLKQLWDYPKYSCPFKRGSKYFYYHNSGLQNQR